MTWTTDKPTTPGWYWWIGPLLHQQIVEVMPFENGDAVVFRPFCGEYNTRMLSDMQGEWAGPIPQPEERR